MEENVNIDNNQQVVKKVQSKRILAYIIDVFIVITLISLISQIKAINPNYKKYNATMEEYNEYYEENFGNVSNLTNEDIMTDEYKNLNYKISYYGLSYMIINASVIVLYFVLFPLFNRSQTIGKRLMKIKCVNDDETKVKWYKLLLRALILPICSSFVLLTPLTYYFNALALLVGPEHYVYANMIILVVFCIYGYIDVIFMLSSKEGKSLHDMITKTKVVEYK